MTDPSSRPVIVVGVDGSEDSSQALRWAAAHARRIGGEVRAVTGWDIPITIMVAPTYTTADYARDAEELLRKSVDEALGPSPEVPVVTRLVQQHPARALVTEAEGAEMLVLGRHGKGELPGLHLGTVASYCIHHAPCPVVLVRRPGKRS
jgi:nucleotide-binding universal stress UspA family protein